MPMQDTINEIYRMRQEADDRERQELEDKIKQCDLNLFAISKDKSEPDEEFRTFYLQRGEMLKQYRRKYGLEAQYRLCDQLNEARKDYVKLLELEAQNKDLKAKIEELTRENNNAKKEQKKAEGELEAVKKKQAEQWVRMLLCVTSVLTLSTTGAQQKVDPKNDSVKPILY